MTRVRRLCPLLLVAAAIALVVNAFALSPRPASAQLPRPTVPGEDNTRVPGAQSPPVSPPNIDYCELGNIYGGSDGQG